MSGPELLEFVSICKNESPTKGKLVAPERLGGLGVFVDFLKILIFPCYFYHYML